MQLPRSNKRWLAATLISLAKPTVSGLLPGRAASEDPASQSHIVSLRHCLGMKQGVNSFSVQGKIESSIWRAATTAVGTRTT